jgi:hypothetical protein
VKDRRITGVVDMIGDTFLPKAFEEAGADDKAFQVLGLLEA